MSAPMLRITLMREAQASQVDSWWAELVGEPSVTTDTLYPCLSLSIRLINRLGQQRVIINLSGDTYIGKEMPTQNQIELRYLGPIHVVGFKTKSTPTQAFQQGLLVLQPQGYLELTALIELSPIVLDRIEQLREGGDLILAIYLKVWWQQRVTTLPVSHAGRPFIRIAKSDWAERILKKAGYMEVTVMELPEPVDIPELRNAIDYLRSAWRSYRIGEYYDAVINIRRALDSLVDGLKNYDPNLVVEHIENNRRFSEPNFKKLAKTDTEADAIAKIYKSLRNIGGLSAHEGAIYVDKQLAELSIITGQAILRYITRRLKEGLQ